MNLIDQLGLAKVALAKAKREVEDLQDKVIAHYGLGQFEGEAYRVSVAECNGRVSVDWKAIAAKLGPSRQLVAAYTSKGADYIRVSVSARSTEPVEA